MNPIQKAWLAVLKPFSYLINDRLAKRSGFFGKIGKFFMIGPREYGSHPINKAFILLNRRVLFGYAILLNRYSFLKTLTHNGYHVLRPFKHVSFFGPLVVLGGLFRFVLFSQHNREYSPDTLPYLGKRIGDKVTLPLNSLNQRTSAHYIEINAIYGGEMIKKYYHRRMKIINERNRASDYEKKMKYADPSYQYQKLPEIYI